MLALPCALLISHERWDLAALLFTVAAISDFYDGRLARAHGSSSAAGGVFDHATDALFVTVCLAAGAHLGVVTVFLPPLIVAAFVQYVLDSRVLAGKTLRGNWLGRTNGIAYFVLTGFVIGVPLLLQWPLPGALTQSLLLLQSAVAIAAAVLCLTTMLSMLNRARYWLRYRG